MKLHLPLSFRKALLACLASLIAPTITLASGAYAAEQPAFSWKDGKFGKSTEDEANIVYRSTPDANGLRLAYLPREAVLGDGNASKVYHWDLNNFGKLEGFHDTDKDLFVWDPNAEWKDASGKVYKGKWIQKESVVHYPEEFDEFGIPVNGIGKDDYRWSLTTELGEGDAKVVFKYDAPTKPTNRWINTNDLTITGTFENLTHDAADRVWEKKFPEITATQSNIGGAVVNSMTTAGIEATFVGNSSLSSMHVMPDTTYIVLSGKNALANEALGGAVYNSGTITDGIASHFAGNVARTEVIYEKSIYFTSTSDVLKTTSLALGGAIYNKGNVTGGIAGDFVYNSAYAIIYTKGGTHYGIASKEYVNLQARGGAIYNSETIKGAIGGNFIGNYAKSQISMAPHGAANYAHVNGFYDATGGAIYNGVDEFAINAPGSSEICASIGDIENAVFVGNFAYNYHATQQGPNGSTSVSLSDYSSLVTYASGGAIYNGIERFDDKSVPVENVSSSVGLISGIFVDNYTYNIDPFFCGQSNNEALPDTNSSKYTHYQLGDWFINKKSHALGGAIYNGVSGGNVDTATLNSSIVGIKGEFVGNYVYVKDYKSRQNGAVMSSSSGSYPLDRSSVRLYASGGAIYNGIDDISIGDNSVVTTEIKEGIDADFTGNYAYIYRQHGENYGDEPDATKQAGSGFGFVYEEDYAAGGAIFNGIADVSTSSGETVTASVANVISGDFTENYAYVKGNAYLAPTHALGGAIYNGIHYTSFGGEVIDGDIATTIGGISDANFVKNYASILNFTFRIDSSLYRYPTNKTDYALGGAIYNGVVGINSSVGKEGELTGGHISGNINSSIETIGSKDAGGKPNVTFVENEAHTTNEMYDDSKSALSHYAFGGAIYNGIERIDDWSRDTGISARIGQITATFQGNSAWNETIRKGTYHAFGGAIYNGINDVSTGTGNVDLSVSIDDGIFGSFSENYATNKKNVISTLTGEFYAFGGAIYNGISGISAQTVPASMSASIGNIEADFKSNFAGKQITQRAFGGAIFNGIASVDGYEGAIENKLTGTPTSINVDSSRKSGTSFTNTYTESATYENPGTFINDLDGNYIDEEVTTKPSSKLTNWNKLTDLTYVNGTISSKIGDITGNFTDNIAQGEIRAEAGSIRNGLEGINGCNSKISNEENLRLQQLGKISVNDVDVTFARELNGNYVAPTEFSNSINNQGGSFIASYNNIHGNFTNSVATTTGNAAQWAVGGAISNTINEINAASANLSNVLILTSYYKSTISGDNSSFVFSDKLNVTASVSTNFNADINNSNGGVIKASIKDISGTFSGNHADSKGKAGGGAIYSSLGSIAAAGGKITNYNGKKIEGTTSDTSSGMCYGVNDSEKQGVSFTYNDVLNRTNFIENKIDVAFNNGDGISKGGNVQIEIGKIYDAYFESNYAEGSSAYGGAVYNGIDKISGAGGDIVNTNYIWHSYKSTLNGKGSHITYDADNTITYTILNDYTAKISNVGGEISSRIDGIEGNFVENHAGTSNSATARGGAIYNSLGVVSGGAVNITNENEILYQYASTSPEGSDKVTFADTHKDKNKAEIVNKFYTCVDNRQGTILTEIAGIQGSFDSNFAVGNTADGGAIYNSIGELSTLHLTVSNTQTDNGIPVQLQHDGIEKEYVIKHEADRSEVNNEGGTIGAVISDISGDHFTGNYVDGRTNANGGAVYNGISNLLGATIDYVKGKELSVDNDIVNAVFNNSNGGKIRVSVGNISSDFDENHASVRGQGEARGGAIYNGIGNIGDNVKIKNTNGGELVAETGTIDGSFSGNYAESANGVAEGGAIYNGIGAIGEKVEIENDGGGVLAARIGSINGSFSDNRATAESGEANGGAIYNGIGESGSDLSAANADGGMFDANIKSITGNFSRNKASSTDGKANGGAIYNSGSIGNITGDFLTNAAEGAEAKGGAIYNTGSIGEIRSTANVYKEGEKSGFSGNTATTSGGAIQNEGSIEGIVNENFTGNSAEALGSALTNIGTIGTIADDATAEREYDNTLVSGIVNSSFTGNTGAEAKAALYTETSLAIIADASQAGNAHVVFEKNTNGGKDSDIYVGRGQDGEMADVYMVATKGSSISTYGEINGDGLYTLRLRGFAERADDLYATHGGANNSNPNYEENGNVNFPGGGLINFQGLVKNANVIMDDVTLKLGTAKSGEEYLTVYEDTITRMNDDHELHPGEILFDGSGGNVSYDDRSKAEGYQREYSDVLRGSRLEARSGHVLANHVADGVLTNYNFGTLVSYGSLSYDPSVENGGYYTDGSVNQNLNTEDERNPLYATWSISLSLSQLNANTITTWVRENDPQTTRGYVTLSGITVLTDHINCDKDTEPFEKWWKEQVENDSISPYLDVTIQVINLRREGEENRTLMDDNDPWRREGDINHSAPLQLDLSLLKQKNEAVAFMDSNDILCEGFGYATTKTYHDSIRLWGWRDNLAAWTELKLNAREVGPNGYEKEFHIIGTHQLTRNIRRIENEALGKDTLLQGTNLMIYGNGYETTTLDVNNKNLLSEIAAGQTLELKDMSIINVGNNHIDNQGTLIMDTLAVENALVVNNDNVTIKRGDWGIAHTFTSSQRSSDTKLAAKAGLLYEAPLRVGQASAGKDSTGISNELHLQAGVSVITGTVEYQNIYHEEGAETHFMVHQEADKRGKQEADDSFTSAEGVTSAFRNFYGNSLTMQGGDFYLYNLNLSELKLRELSISDGTIHLNAVTVKLDASEKEGTMGRIWAFDNAEYTGSGHILVEANALQLIRKDGKGELRSGDDRYYEGGEHYAIPVQFVNPEVAASVIPFGKENDYAEGADGKLSTAYKMEAAKFVYDVDYDYETGVYTYRRPVEPKHDDFTPDAITGPVAQAAGAVASMMFLNQYVFQHADLFSANMNRAREARLRDQSHNTVTPVKGYKGATPAAPKAACTDQPVAFKGGMWVRPYAGYEKLPLHKGPKVSNRLYGAIVGGDTDVTEYDSGWASVFSAHAAYMGSTQRFSGRLSGARIQQNGGAVGVTETLYKGKFYTALSATIGTSSGHASTSAGSENFRMVLGGVASRSGYSFELDRGKYIVQPTLLVSYSMVNTSSYTNASGSRIASSPLHTIQVHPYVKVVMNTDSCWQPYLTLGYVHHFMGKTKFRADDVSLPGMSINPYVEYSVGVQRTWADRYTIFGEIIGRNGGRNGVEANVGIRWTW